MKKVIIKALIVALLVSVASVKDSPDVLADKYSDLCATDLAYGRRSFDPVGGCNCPEGEGEAISLNTGIAQIGGCYSNLAVADAVINLSSLDGTNGLTIYRTIDIGGIGTSVSSAGDVNGDGYDDIIIGAPWSDINTTNSGAAYVLFGKADWSANHPFNVTGLNGSNGFQINGIGGKMLGYSTYGAGDFNNDGYDDIALGMGQQGAAGTVYIIFGKADWATGYAPFDLTTLNGTNGIQINGNVAGSALGLASSAGDVNGDGISDLILGASGADPGGKMNAGEAYLVFGKGDWATGYAPLELSALNGSNGFQMNGIDAWDYSGASIASAGDVNGDGYGDVIIGAFGGDPGGGSFAGEVYVVFGKADWATGYAPLEFSALNGSNGFQLNGIAAGDYAGYSVSGAGDVNKDGYNDIIIGATSANSPGRSYTIFGKADWATGYAPLDISALVDGSQGFKIQEGGRYSEALVGYSVSSAGDFNKDGYSDVLVGAKEDDSVVDDGMIEDGITYLLFGGGSAATTLTTEFTGVNGIAIHGKLGQYSWAGYSVSSAGDFNGDGYGDVIIGAPAMNAWRGESYIVFGFDPTAPKE